MPAESGVQELICCTKWACSWTTSSAFDWKRRYSVKAMQPARSGSHDSLATMTYKGPLSRSADIHKFPLGIIKCGINHSLWTQRFNIWLHGIAVKSLFSAWLLSNKQLKLHRLWEGWLSNVSPFRCQALRGSTTSKDGPAITVRFRLGWKLQSRDSHGCFSTSKLEATIVPVSDICRAVNLGK